MPRVWVVEDDPTIAEIMAAMLAPQGYEVLRLEGAEVVGMASLAPPDLVIVDLWMETMRGEQVVAYLRSRSETAITPIIVCSALREGAATARTMGVVFLDKPFGIDDLIHAVQSGLAHRGGTP